MEGSLFIQHVHQPLSWLVPVDPVLCCGNTAMMSHTLAVYLCVCLSFYLYACLYLSVPATYTNDVQLINSLAEHCSVTALPWLLLSYIDVLSVEREILRYVAELMYGQLWCWVFYECCRQCWEWAGSFRAFLFQYYTIRALISDIWWVTFNSCVIMAIYYTEFTLLQPVS